MSAAPPVHDVVTPWHAVPLSEQHARKRAEVHARLVSISEGIEEHVAGTAASASASGKKRARDAAAAGVPLRLPLELSWLSARAQSLGGAACLLGPLVHAPSSSHYRNKVALTFGRDAGGAVTLGFRVGRFESGDLRVESAPSYVHVPAPISRVAAVAGAWCAASPLPPYDPAARMGVWRELTVRIARGECLVELMAKAPDGAPDSDPNGAPYGAPNDNARAVFDAEVARLLAALRELRAEGDGAPLLVSFYLQVYGGSSTPDASHPRALLWGARALREELCGRVFSVSPSAFMQVNPPVAELLYTLAARLASEGVAGARALLGPTLRSARGGEAAADVTEGFPGAATAPPPALQRDAALLDVCCGTGTLGVICAPLFARVIGVDTCEAAIADARENAARNSCAGAGVEGNSCARAGVGGNSCAGAGGAPLTTLGAAAETEEGSSAGIGAGGGTGRADDPSPTPAGAATSTPTPTHPPLYVCGAAETVLPDLIADAARTVSRFVAIVDPPRSGLHYRVIRALRTTRGLRRIVYISCNPASLVADAIKLCVPAEPRSAVAHAKGPPFRPVLAVPLDMAPHTPGVETVVLFERDR